MSVKIVSVKAVTSVRLSRRGKIVNPFSPIWEEGVDVEAADGSLLPAAFVLDAGKPAGLEVTIQLGDDIEMGGGEYMLEGLYNEKILLFSSTGVVPGRSQGQLVFDMQLQWMPEGITSIIGKNISWRLASRQGGETMTIQPVFLELHWIYADNSHLFDRGFPVEMLRDVSVALKNKGEITPDRFDFTTKGIRPVDEAPTAPGPGWTIEKTVNWVFKRNPPRYDIDSGGAHYIQFSGYPVWDNITLNLTQYLNAHSVSTSLCNCYDMAAVVQNYLWVIGIESSKIKYCFMEPFGYLKKTDLVGRGECNNPFYGSTGGKPVVEEKDPKRTAFGNHAFCRYTNPEGSYRITDACAGPSTGNQNVDQYMASAVDTVYPEPPRVPQGTTSDINYYRGVTNVNTTSSMKEIPGLPFTEDFMKEVGISSRTAAKLPRKYVVCSWPDPAKCPHLGGEEKWITKYDAITPGMNEATRTWILEKSIDKDNQAPFTIELRIHVSSSGNDLSLYRFIAQGSLSSMPHMPYKNGPANLGNFSAKVEQPNFLRHFWVFHNTVFDVTVHNHDDKNSIHNFLEWLNQMAEQNSKNSLDKDFPPIDGIDCPKTKLKPGETVTVNLKHQNHLLHDVKTDGKGLLLIDERKDSLLFSTHKESQNDISVIVVDKKTLLVNCKRLTVEVKK